MDKNFDEWNEIKKETDFSELNRKLYFHEREIWWGSIGLNIGVESNGKNATFERPMLILKVFNKDMLWILPVTSGFRKSKFYYAFRFKNEERSIMLTQIRAISSKRLIRKFGILAEDEFELVVQYFLKLLKNENPLDTSG